MLRPYLSLRVLCAGLKRFCIHSSSSDRRRVAFRDDRNNCISDVRDRSARATIVGAIVFSTPRTYADQFD